jgi:hypothetical protein
MYKVTVLLDNDTPSPNTHYGWKLYSFSRRHMSFRDPDTLTHEIGFKVAKGEAYWLSYFEHGNVWWGRKGGEVPAGVEFQWDGREYAGMLIWEGSGPAPGPDSADAFLAEYTDWANGHCFQYYIDNAEGEQVDSLSGLIGAEYAAEVIKAFLGGAPFVAEGEAANILK